MFSNGLKGVLRPMFSRACVRPRGRDYEAFLMTYVPIIAGAECIENIGDAVLMVRAPEEIPGIMKKDEHPQ